LIFGDLLDIRKKVIFLPQSPIYFLYKEYTNKALILYMPDEHRIVYIDLKSFVKYVIRLPRCFNEEIFLPNYYWKDDVLIFTTTHNTFYQLNFTSKTLDKIASDKVRNFCMDFFNFWNVCKKYKILTLYPSEKSFIFQNRDYGVGFFNFKKNKKIMVAEQIVEGWHDIEYYNGIFFLFMKIR